MNLNCTYRTIKFDKYPSITVSRRINSYPSFLVSLINITNQMYNIYPTHHGCDILFLNSNLWLKCLAMLSSATTMPKNRSVMSTRTQFEFVVSYTKITNIFKVFQ